jgi:hypothetical protein
MSCWPIDTNGLVTAFVGCWKQVRHSVHGGHRSIAFRGGALEPEVVVVDLSLSSGDMSGLLRRLPNAPGANILLLSVHDERRSPNLRWARRLAVVLERCLATDRCPPSTLFSRASVTCRK